MKEESDHLRFNVGDFYDHVSEEVTHIDGKRISAEVTAINPAFDITPAENIECLITEVGLLKKPYTESLGRLKKKDQ